MQSLKKMVSVVGRFSQPVGRLVGGLRRGERVDPLTQLWSRGHILAELTRACERAKEWTAPVSVLLADIDGLRGINESCGHGAGDRVLVELGRAMAGAMEESGVIGRYGGEEFLLVLSDTTPFHAMQVAERVRAAVERMPVELSDGLRPGLVLRPTVSLGVATSSTFRESGAELIESAERALCEAKTQGRNTVCFAPERWEKQTGTVGAALRAG